MDKASWDADHNYGWLSIGSLSNNPFRGIYDGGGYAISNLWASRPSSAGIGLFDYVENTGIKHVVMKNPRMEGNFAVGALVGASVTAGDSRDRSIILACSTSDGYVRTSSGSAGAGGLLGVVDMYATCLVDSCSNEGTSVSGDYGIGGLVGMGSMYSVVDVEQSSNYASVTSEFTGAGGIVGTADTLYVMGCSNEATIIGGRSYTADDDSNGGYGTGGIAGGSGVSYIYASTNKGNVTGNIGVGGIIGSTRIGSEELMFNNTLIKSCENTGNVTGETAVGGICGEAQFGCYAAYNTGTITATGRDSHVGGIVGNTSIAVVHNALNGGTVCSAGTHCAGGVIGKTTWGAVFACQNVGDMNVNADYAGGIIGLAGNYTMVNFCAHIGSLSNTGSGGATGGIIGEIGDPREWSAADIASCVIGSLECVLAIAGPVISLTGTAVAQELEGLEGVATVSQKTLKPVGELTHVLHISDTALDKVLILSDTGIFIYGLEEMMTEKNESQAFLLS